MTRAIVVCAVLAAACGKTDSKKPETKTGTPSEPAVGRADAGGVTGPDAACAAKLKELEPWLAAFELESSSYEIDFGYKLQVIDRAPMPVGTDVDNVAVTATSIEAFDASEHDHASSKLGKTPAQKAVADRLTTIHAMANNAPDQLRVDVDQKAAWKDVVRVVEAATKAGYKEAVFAFTATSKVAVPAGAEPWTSNAEDMSAASKKLREMQKQCKPWDSAVLEHISKPSKVENAQAWAKEIAEAIGKCNCAVSPDDVRLQTFKSARWHQAVPRVGVVVQLADNGAAVTAPGKAAWSEAYGQLLAAAPDGAASPPAVKLVAK